MLQWRKTDYGYLCEEAHFKIHKNGGYLCTKGDFRILPKDGCWILTTLKGSEIGRFLTVKAAKDYAETLA